MERRKLKLPIGVQTFEKLRNGNNVYVDMPVRENC